MGKTNAGKYPIFLNLEGKTCLVVGGGRVARRKTAALLEAGARVKVVAPDISESLTELAENGQVELAKRPFAAGDMDGAVLVIAATDDGELNQSLRAEAMKQGALINVVDEPELCDFFVPAVVNRGSLQIAVSTGGVSPGLARALRRRLEGEFGPEYADYLNVIGDFRRRVRDFVADPEARKRAYERLFESDVLDRIRNGERIDIESLVGEYVS